MLNNRLMAKILAASIVGAFIFTGGVAFAQEKLPPHSFKVLGSFANLSPFLKYEQPFWTEVIAEKSGGSITATIRPHTELGLKGFEILRLLNLGVFDFGHVVIGYIASDNPAFEGLDLAGLTQDFKTQREISERYKQILEPLLEKKHGVKLLGLNPYPSQMVFCRSEVKSLADLKGKKVRVYSATLGDFVEGSGAVSATIAFPEVIPALEKGTIDCSIGGGSTAYAGKWYEVANSIYGLRVGYGMAMIFANLNTWDSLDDGTKKLITEQMKAYEDRIWDGIAREDQEGIDCNIGKACSLGKPANMKLFEPSPEDVAQRKLILKNSVLKHWVERCGEACADDWNKTVGKVLGITAN
ncbi:TRAP transporter substrate-binding protein [Candidatus Nitrotoga sp. M5]|uniref:TRAP transporter substrate-binding protein n=1 Tax=Candidatus Nitrotoga sp. M5 TaxID=2890409 RepID=UPI001EF6A635|nr:TRAP transporter substrate-binding protein [Candidatus Nitrotoga sp. M5]CAH1387507.1 Transporter [Candidatus Nitrotoga sp. M5]